MSEGHGRIEASRATVLVAGTLLLVMLAGWAVLPVGGHVGGSGGVTATIVETNTPVAEGDTLNVTVELENTADDAHTFRAVFYIGGKLRDSETVNLAARESRTVTLSWDTQSGDAGDYEAVVEVGEDYDRVDVSIRTPADLAVSITETNSPIVEGQALAVTATVENRGGMPVTETVSMAVAGEIRDSTTISIGGNETQTVTLTWDTESGQAGAYDLSVQIVNATATTSIEVETASANESVNEAPRANISVNHDGQSVKPGISVEFEAEASDPDGEVVEYEWRIDGEIVSTEQSVSYTFEEAGMHEVRLIVTDDDGSPTAVTRTIHVARAETSTASTVQSPTPTSGASGAGFGVLLLITAVCVLLGLSRVP